MQKKTVDAGRMAIRLEKEDIPYPRKLGAFSFNLKIWFFSNFVCLF